MKIGINLALWTDTLGEECLPLLEKCKSIGYDVVELPVFDTDLNVAVTLGKRLDELGLERSGGCAFGPDHNMIAPDPLVRRRGVNMGKAALDFAAVAGVKIFIGHLPSALGVFSGRGPTGQEWGWGVEAMQELSEYADKLDITLGLEAVNRFECYLFNCMADTLRFIKDVNHKRCQLMYDTFHANIEEKDVAAAIRGVKEHLIHVHISECDRSTPGQGGIRWKETFDALHEIDYNGYLVCEAFGAALPKLAAATKIWRNMFENADQLARDAYEFMRKEIDNRK
ncbi:MAG: sugar phosphate isomerase/epimerase [Planctomycetaceae bacterium]|nr:sugar phosphate isomerase/epimerase [Planctomycetaceae bacterium]